MGDIMIFIQIAGHLGQDPETRYTPNGQKVTTMRVATTIKRGGKEKTVWWKITMWGDRFDRKLTYLKKGSAVIVWGEMGMPDIYQDREGNPQTSFEIIAEHVGFSPFGGGKGERPAGDEEGSEAPAAYASNHQGYGAGAQTAPRFAPKAGGAQQSAGDAFGQFAEDDIPF